MSIILDGTSGITSPGGDTSTSLTTGTLTATTENITNLTTSKLTIGTTQLGAGNASIMKNRIINGAMVIDQRNAGASVTIPATAQQYTLDRFWCQSIGASKFSVQQNAGSVTPPVGFINYLGITSLATTSSATGDYYSLVHNIEGFNTADLGWGSANAKTVTLSFQVYSSLTGTFSASLKNSASNPSYPFTYSIPVANTWTTINVTIAGSTTGTWITNNGSGIILSFNLGCGSTYLSSSSGSWQAGNYYGTTGSVSVVGTSGATFYITGVQLEVGSSATGFEYRQYGQELALCQRYYYKNNYSATAIIATVQTYNTSGSAFGQLFTHPVPMRAVPTTSNSGATTFQLTSTISTRTATTAITINPTLQGITLGDSSSGSTTIAGGASVLYSNTSGTTYIDASAEL